MKLSLIPCLVPAVKLPLAPSSLLVRAGGREGNRALLTDREEGAKGSVTAGTRQGVRDNFIDVIPGSSFMT